MHPPLHAIPVRPRASPCPVKPKLDSSSPHLPATECPRSLSSLELTHPPSPATQIRPRSASA
ncbi:hypothetical protein HETIRDRAFT_144852 [Heterobasidion irregulare TC 32-1]|uniref:Uncharacterized protein n=1 Tax=Heterobasidion irregulare (strain TC 32-1) TaxID=747525 RepID=W4KAM9_HETIT|nr:uncharacterized protein HETIRDRAFT_144852 [Heterobasidion irregulare TC 32-1]ETW82420.1 hypothetical protein HETIRDRAFT_144852 [Heterobasidion irregulare TC 32-1]